MKARFDDVLGWIGAEFGCARRNALGTLQAWSRKAGLRALSALGLSRDDCLLAADAALASSSMKANPVALTATRSSASMDAAF